jgi:hypothetical protein
VTPDGDVTLGELFRSMGKLEKSVDDGFKTIGERFDALADKYVSKELYESEREALNARIVDATRGRRWLTTTAIAVVGAVADLFYFLTHIHG